MLLCELNYIYGQTALRLTHLDHIKTNYNIFIFYFYGFRMSSVMFVHPFDLVKNRMQLSGKYSSLSANGAHTHSQVGQGGIGRVYNTSIHAAASVISNEGAFAVYKG